ncbi:hypothetical protein [Aquabacterium sp.]|uniref:hypothetical protein n=1 Tax=Aquabacterium sp. TaxID=1872578 RepID=UPI002620D3AD|nr:hypothetical protein [Aquabacterium sp.]MDD2975203.1 hypothetical protein [Aquabacterium sp.]
MKHFTLSPSLAFSRLWRPVACLTLALAPVGGTAYAQQVYRCPGNLYTDALSPKEAAAKGCKTLDGAPITVIQSMTPRASSTGNRNTGTSAASSSPENKVASEEQKARDTDARRILEAELRKEEAALESLKKDFNNGQPERRGDERNYQKYLDRVNEMKAALTRKEADVASLRRELSKFGGGGAK